MAKKLILVAGNIGSGKTSLTERIGQQLGWRTAYESVVNNPYLPHFLQGYAHLVFSFAGLFPGASRQTTPGDGGMIPALPHHRIGTHL
jgi:hypothetical protein